MKVALLLRNLQGFRKCEELGKPDLYSKHSICLRPRNSTLLFQLVRHQTPEKADLSAGEEFLLRVAPDLWSDR